MVFLCLLCFRFSIVCIFFESLNQLTFLCYSITFFFFFFKQKTAYEMRISEWSSDVCSSDLAIFAEMPLAGSDQRADRRRVVGLGHRDQADVLGAPLRARCRLRHRGLHFGQPVRRLAHLASIPRPLRVSRPRL